MTKSTLRLEPNLSLTDFPVLQSLKYLSLSILASVPLIQSFKILRALISRESPKFYLELVCLLDLKYQPKELH